MTGRVKIAPPKSEESWADDHIEVHPAVQLLLGLMESHPEQFHERVETGQRNTHPSGIPVRSTIPTSQPNQQWAAHKMHIDSVTQHWNRKEKRLYNTALRNIRMEEYHQKLMGIVLK